jgi:serine/threonine protein kinase
MTRDEALQLLGLGPEADADAVRTAFHRRHVELVQRITSATTVQARKEAEDLAARTVSAHELLMRFVGSPVDRPSPANQTLNSPRPNPTMSTDSSQSANAGLSVGEGLGIAVGDVLAQRFETRAFLGSGGMGHVYGAFDRTRKEEVALKVLRPELLRDPNACERFLDEARVTSNLSHPNIVRVYDVHQTERLTFLTMEWLKGRSLRAEIADRSGRSVRFTVDEVCRLAEGVCAALEYAHNREIVHRDVKPENIWLCDDGSVKLMDFGIARLLRPSQFTSQGLALGTAYYMAPEQLRGRDVDSRADQFAVGVVLYELLTGEIPQGAIRPPRELRRSVPAGLSQAVMKALQGRADARYSDIPALARAVRPRRDRGNAWARVFTAAAVVVAIGVAVLILFRTPTTGPGRIASGEHDAAAAGATESQVKYGAEQSLITELQRKAEKAEEGIERAEKEAQDELERRERDVLAGAARSANGATSAEAGQQKDAGARLERARADRARVATMVGLWQQHPRRTSWREDAIKHVGAAHVLAQGHDYDKALAELQLAEPLLRFPIQWHRSVEEALPLLDRCTAMFTQLGGGQDGSEAVTYALLDRLKTRVEGASKQLVRGDGSDAVGDLKAAWAAVSALAPLDSLRRDIARSETLLNSEASQQAFLKLPELRAERDAAVAAVRRTDDTLFEAQASGAGEAYQSALETLRGVPRKLTRMADGRLADAVDKLKSRRFADARTDLREVLRLRPGDIKVGTLLPIAVNETACLGSGSNNHYEVSPDHQRVITYDDDGGVLLLWDAMSGTLVQRLQLPQASGKRPDSPQGAFFSPDGTLLAAYRDENLVLWDAKEGRELRGWKTERDKQTNTAGTFRGGQFSALGRRLLAAEDYVRNDLVIPNGTREVRLWDSADGRLIFRVSNVTRGWLSPDGSRVVCDIDHSAAALFEV